MPPKPVALTPAARWVQACDRAVEVLLDLVFLTVPLVFIILTRDQFELPKLTVLRILTALMLGLWGVRLLLVKRWQFRATPLDLPILAWLGLQVLTTVVSVSPYVSWLGEYENFRGLLTVGNYAILYYLLVNFVRTRAQIDRLLFMVLLAGLLTTAYGISQFFGVDFIAWNPNSISKGRYFSTLGNPNFLAAYLAMVMPLVVVFFIETPSLFKRLLLFVTFVGMFLCLLGTWSRGGFLGLVGALGVLTAFGIANAVRYYRGEGQKRGLTLLGLAAQELRRHKLWASVLVVLLLILTALSATLGRTPIARVASTVVHFQDAIKVSRLHIWGPALNMIRQHPWLGLGLDTFKTAFPRYATASFAAIDGANVASRTAHNEVLQVLSTQGVIGLAIVLWLTLALLQNWFRAYRLRRDNWRDRLILYGLLGSWTAYSLQNLFSFGVAALDTFYWLIFAIIVLMQVTPEDQERLAPSQVPESKPGPFFAAVTSFRPLAIAGIAALVVGASWQAWNIAEADFIYNRASYYRMQEMWDASLQDFVAAAKLVPWEVKYAVYSGLAYEEKAKVTADPEAQKRYLGSAIAAYQRGVQMNPTNAYYLGNLGRAYGLASELDRSRPELYTQAVDYYRQAIAQGSVTVLFYQNLGVLYLSHGDEKGFEEIQAQLGAFDPVESARLDFTAANQFYAQGDLVRADHYYGLALGHNPKYIEALFNLGIVRVQRFGPAQALPLWRQVLEINPAFEPAQQMLQRYATPGGRANAGDILIPRR